MGVDTWKICCGPFCAECHTAMEDQATRIQDLERAVEVLAKANNKWVDNWQDRYNKNVDGWMIALPEIAAVDENPIAKAAIEKARKEAGNG